MCHRLGWVAQELFDQMQGQEFALSGALVPYDPQPVLQAVTKTVDCTQSVLKNRVTCHRLGWVAQKLFDQIHSECSPCTQLLFLSRLAWVAQELFDQMQENEFAVYTMSTPQQSNL